ncbi:MAG: DNA starvation/stationary phase protection protein [Chloroflexi bacterium]|nr:DNA starvation/stationary phase protection protein [Chloroflexota bacterium]
MAVSSPRSQTSANGKASPILHQRGKELQKYGTLRNIPLGLADKARAQNVETLNQILADTITLRDLYQKHHWQAAGPTFYQLHLLFEKHYNELNEIVDQLAERIQTLGGISLAMAADIAETTTVPRPPRGSEPPPVQISRLLEAHEIVIKETRDGAKQADENGDDGTNDLLVSSVVRTNELQVWFLSEHLVDTDLVHAE